MSVRTIEKFSASEVAVAIALGSAPLLILGVQPIILGELVSSGHVDLDGVGLIAMGEIIAIGLGVGIAGSIFSLNRFRLIAVLAGLVVIGANLMSSQSVGFADLLSARVIAGLGTGALVWITSSLIVRVRNPERTAGVFLAVQTLAQAVVAAILALLIVPGGSWSWSFAALAVFVAVPSLFVAYLPAKMQPLTEENSSQPPITIGVVLASLVVVFQMAVVGSLWTFIEPISVAAGLETQSVQLVISFTLIMQAIGGGVAAIVAPKLEPRNVLMIGGVIQCVIAFYFGHYLTDDMAPFVIACAIFGFMWLFLMPFHVRLAFWIEPTGRLALFGPSLQLLGSALGPLAASMLVTADDASPAAMATAGFAALSVALLLAMKVIGSQIVVGESQQS
jgi:predicted MFS family arabinose efflux permease